MSINTQRFDWKRATRQEYAGELLRRNIKRYTTKDCVLPCGVCGARHIKRHNHVYYPAVGLSKDNEVIGHADCVELVAMGKTPTSMKREKQPLVAAAASMNAGVVLKGDVSIAELHRLQGFRDGVVFALTGKESGSGEDNLEWFKGWREGVQYIKEHRAG